jgi:hypothetical protein
VIESQQRGPRYRRERRTVPEWFSAQNLIAQPWERAAVERV